MTGFYAVLSVLFFLSWLLSLVTAFMVGRMAEKTDRQLFYLELVEKVQDLLNSFKGEKSDDSGNAIKQSYQSAGE